MTGSATAGTDRWQQGQRHDPLHQHGRAGRPGRRRADRGDLGRDRRPARAHVRTARHARGMLENLAGIRERRWWPHDVSFTDAAAMAGAKAIAEAGVDPSQIGLLIDTSVSRAYLEPSGAVAVHHSLGLPSSALNFDLANACLGFVNGMQLAATMIDAGQIEYAIVVDGEGSRQDPGAHDRATGRSHGDEDRPADAVRHADARVRRRRDGARPGRPPLGRAPVPRRRRAGRDRAPRPVRRRPRAHAHRHPRPARRRARALGRGVGRGEVGVRLVGPGPLRQPPDLPGAHERHVLVARHRPGAGPADVPDARQHRPASVPFTLAGEVETLSAGDRVLLMGIGSGLNVSCVELAW